MIVNIQIGTLDTVETCIALTLIDGSDEETKFIVSNLHFMGIERRKKTYEDILNFAREMQTRGIDVEGMEKVEALLDKAEDESEVLYGITRSKQHGSQQCQD